MKRLRAWWLAHGYRLVPEAEYQAFILDRHYWRNVADGVSELYVRDVKPRPCEPVATMAMFDMKDVKKSAENAAHSAIDDIIASRDAVRALHQVLVDILNDLKAKKPDASVP